MSQTRTNGKSERAGRADTHGQAIDPGQAKAAQMLASGGLYTTREAAQFVNASLLDLFSGVLSPQTSRAGLAHVGKLVTLAKLRQVNSGQHVTLVENSHETPSQRRRRELQEELAALENGSYEATDLVE